MKGFKVIVIFALILEMTKGQKGFKEPCSLFKGPDGKTVDPCDQSKYLLCNNGLCDCQDPTHQLYSFKLIPGPTSSPTPGISVPPSTTFSTTAPTSPTPDTSNPVPSSFGTPSTPNPTTGISVPPPSSSSTTTPTTTIGSSLTPAPAPSEGPYHSYMGPSISIRSRRSPKKGGSSIAKAVSKGVSKSSGAHKFGSSNSKGGHKYVTSQKSKSKSSSSETTTDAPPQFIKIYSCYQRVQSPCLLQPQPSTPADANMTFDPLNPQPSIPHIQNTTNQSSTLVDSSTKPTPSIIDPVNANSSTTVQVSQTSPIPNVTVKPVMSLTPTANPSTISETTLVGQKVKMVTGECVRNAVCMPRSSGSPGNGSTEPGSPGIESTDPRVGICSCKIGFRATNTDFLFPNPTGSPLLTNLSSYVQTVKHQFPFTSGCIPN